ncbi:hypothetical protein D3C75_1263610 [compost metagenome]
MWSNSDDAPVSLRLYTTPAKESDWQYGATVALAFQSVCAIAVRHGGPLFWAVALSEYLQLTR